MRLLRTDSTEYDAEFGVTEVAGGQMEITIESAGGVSAAGQRRNPDYRRLLEELLRRLGTVDATLHDAFVSSRTTAHLPVADRRISIPGRAYPLTLTPTEDFDRLRKDLTGAQANIGSARVEGGGNERKRMTLVVSSAEVPSRQALIARIRAVESRNEGVRRSGVATGLSVSDIEAAIELWHHHGRDRFLGEFQASAARKYVVVDGSDEIDAMALLLGARALAGLDSTGHWRGDSPNVAEPLRKLGFAVQDLAHPLEGPLGPEPDSYVDLARRLGGTDVAIRRMGRREQGFLRGALGIGAGPNIACRPCGLCGRSFPLSFLVAAHIKPRHLCSHEERLDLPHIGWALCLAGCDALFEQGYVTIQDSGIVNFHAQSSDTPAVIGELSEPLVGKRAPGWTPQRSRYFAAHRTLHAAS